MYVFSPTPTPRQTKKSKVNGKQLSECLDPSCSWPDTAAVVSFAKEAWQCVSCRGNDRPRLTQLIERLERLPVGTESRAGAGEGVASAIVVSNNDTTSSSAVGPGNQNTNANNTESDYNAEVGEVVTQPRGQQRRSVVAPSSSLSPALAQPSAAPNSSPPPPPPPPPPPQPVELATSVAAVSIPPTVSATPSPPSAAAAAAAAARAAAVASAAAMEAAAAARAAAEARDREELEVAARSVTAASPGPTAGLAAAEDVALAALSEPAGTGSAPTPVVSGVASGAGEGAVVAAGGDATGEPLSPPARRDCMICASAPVQTRFLPCHHSLACLNCASLLRARGDRCPVDRARITAFETGQFQVTYSGMS